jgi:hypothetical protein
MYSKKRDSPLEPSPSSHSLESRSPATPKPRAEVSVSLQHGSAALAARKPDISRADAWNHPGSVGVSTGLGCLRGRLKNERTRPDSRLPRTLSHLPKGKRIRPFFGSAKAKPNKAKPAKTLIMREMYDRFIKQSQTTYPDCSQSVERILGHFFAKNECYRSMNSKDQRNKAKQSQTA